MIHQQQVHRENELKPVADEDRVIDTIKSVEWSNGVTYIGL